ncbi:MAG: PEP-utilizing enzyme [Anaerolineales bacterium]
MHPFSKRPAQHAARTREDALLDVGLAWTPLFARISGLITDLGGPLAHGSIVAREVGILAVMGTGNATQKIHSGQVVTILGSEGKVLVG